jgi:hypothetical protein
MSGARRRGAAVDKIGRLELGVFVTLVVALITGGGLYLDSRPEVASVKAPVRALQTANQSLKATANDRACRLAAAESGLKPKTKIVIWAYQQCRMSAEQIQRIDATSVSPSSLYLCT